MEDGIKASLMFAIFTAQGAKGLKPADFLATNKPTKAYVSVEEAFGSIGR